MITNLLNVINMDNVNAFYFWRAISKARRSFFDVDLGRVVERRKARQSVLLKAWQAHPERFVRGTPRPPELEPITYINRSEEGEAA